MINKTINTIVILLLISFSSFGNTITNNQPQEQSLYRTKDESVKGLLEAISSSMKRPVIISKLAAAKKISGEFVIVNPEVLLNKITNILGLIWFFDGQNIYVYEASEAKNILITLKNINFSVLENFLIKSKIYDDKYPIRGDDLSNTFYLSGPPIYIDLVRKAVETLDSGQEHLTNSKVIAIPLHYSFTENRTYQYRDEKITIPGMATVISKLLNSSNSVVSIDKEQPNLDDKKLNELALKSDVELKSLIKSKPGGTLVINSDPNSNSILVQGSNEQILLIKQLVSLLDKPKRHIELSVWIIDIDKSVVNQLGINWGAYSSQGDLSINLNSSSQSTTLNGNHFLASIFALVQNKQANIVSRPLILTQENIPAVFDNSRTFYTKLIGERTSDLNSITYGTSVSVLPRFTKTHEIELMLNIEDGNSVGDSTVDEYSSLPIVGKTNISTIARVPEGKSLLIGGYSKDEVSTREERIPILGDIPLLGRLFRYENKNNSKSVRMFLIQPKEIKDALKFNTSVFNKNLINQLKQEPLQDWVDIYLESELWR